MSIRKMMVAFDDSDHSRKALQIAADLARPHAEIEIDIVHVAPLPLLSDMEATSLQIVTEMMIENGKEILQHAYDSVEDLDDRIKTLLLTSVSPSLELLKLIEGGDYDMVVIGSRGLSGIKAYLGSVSYKVLHESSVPVLVVK